MRSQEAWVPLLTLPHTSCVTVGRPLHLSELLFPNLPSECAHICPLCLINLQRSHEIMLRGVPATSNTLSNCYPIYTF